MKVFSILVMVVGAAIRLNTAAQLRKPRVFCAAAREYTSEVTKNDRKVVV